MSAEPGPTGADIQAAFCAVLVDEWVRAGVTDAVVAPGSRSTPMVLALASEGRIRVHVVLDERAAGFVALGLGVATSRPAVVVTTSGTASVELHPAIVEAHQAGVPLIAVTTDRPPELHHVGAPQTVEQEDLFAGALRWKVAPGVAERSGSAGWRSLGSRGVAESLTGPAGPGPVHLNLAFREPLIGSPEAFDPPAGRSSGRPWHTADRLVDGRGSDLSAMVAWPAGGRGLLVVGEGAARNADDVATILDAAGRLGWPVFADPRSGCRRPHPNVVAAADSLLRMPEVADWRPDLVVTIGAPWASKVLGQWLSSLHGCTHVLIDPWGRWPDPDRRADHVVAADPVAVMSSLPAWISPPEWSARWRVADAAAQEALEGSLGKNRDLEMSEPAVARSVHASVPEGGEMVVSSSMPIRDVEWFAATRRGVSVRSNRGANGIDGVLATSIGVALSGRPTVALLGDLAFLYDAGSLLWAAGRDVALTVVVIDNDGGGIFSFLPQATALDPRQFEAYWGTPHGVDLVALAAVYGATASSVDSPEELVSLMGRADQPGVRVAVVKSNRSTNVADHDLLNRRVADAVRAALV
jgi:2-succinyl-5-enolpyruvyl-6-hydroxy-3-cyclohexene-1-carboxylate synthase